MKSEDTKFLATAEEFYKRELGKNLPGIKLGVAITNIVSILDGLAGIPDKTGDSFASIAYKYIMKYYELTKADEALFWARNLLSEKAMEDLTSKGAKVNIYNEEGDSLLLLAVKAVQIDMVELLLKHGAKPDIGKTKGELTTSPLHIACYNTDTQSAEHLLKYEANVNLEDKAGYTVLDYAAADGNIKMLKFLLKQKDINIGSAMLIAQAKNHIEAVKLLTPFVIDSATEESDTSFEIDSDEKFQIELYEDIDVADDTGSSLGSSEPDTDLGGLDAFENII